MDERQNNRVDKLFRDFLLFHREKPSGNLWAKIENNLNRADRLAYIARIWRRMLITVGLVLIMTGLGIYSYHSIHPRKKLAILTENKNINRSGALTKIQQINNEASCNQHVLPNETFIQKTHSLTEHQISFLTSLNPEINLVKDTTENDLPLIATQISESGISLIQPVSINTFPQPEYLEKVIARPENKSLLNKLSLTAFFSQEFAGYNLSDEDATAADGREIEDRERTAFSASTGFYLNYHLNKRWTIQSGLSYSWSTSDIDSSTSYAVKDNSGKVHFKMNTISGYGYLQYPPSLLFIAGDSIMTGKAISRTHYLTIPLILSYRIPMKRISLLLGAGLSFNLLTKAYLETKIYSLNLMGEEATTPIKGLKNLYYGIILKADLEYHINNRLGVNLIPAFENSLSPINIHSALSDYPYNFGLGLGISYQF